MKFLFAIVSKDDKFSIPADAVGRFRTERPDSKVVEIASNREKLTVLGNRLMDGALKDGFDFFVLMHADVEVDFMKLAEHIEACAPKYDVMGLCGCEKLSVSESPLNWFCGSRKYPDFRWGCVCHGELGNHVSFFSQDHQETTDHAVACIDGLCMVFSKAAMESGLRFDEELGFNCYDTQISLDAVMNKKLRVGCLVERDLKHFSVGRSILGDAFLEDEIKLRKRFGFEVPKGSRLEKYLSGRPLLV